MSKLTRLKDIVDHHLQDVTMTESQKAEVRRRIAAGEPGRRQRRGYGWAYSAGALALACLLLVFLVFPMLPARGGAPDKGSNASNGIENTGSPESGSGNADGMTFDVLAAARTSGVVTPDTDFLIEVAGGTISADELEERITIEPAVPFTLQAESETLYTLTPSEPFENGEIVTVSIATGEDTAKSWAFQTDATLHIESTLPGNNAEGMPLETGIELNFSRIVSSGMENHFEISPATPGAFHYYGKTVAFVPDQELSPNTVYTVTVKPGLTADSGETMETAYSFSFRTPAESFGAAPQFYLANAFTETFVPGDAIAVGVYASEEFTTAEVTLYSTGGAERYRELAHQKYDALHPVLGADSDVQISSDGLVKIDTFETELVSLGENYWYGPSFAILPDLAEGWYFAEISVSDADGNEYTVQKLIQVSPLSVYYQALNGEALVWLNDTQSGGSLSGADVTLTADGTASSAKTGADGVASMTYRSTDAAYAELSISAGGHTFVDFVRIDGTAEADASGDYYTYIYLDREVYQPTDTVRYWGIILPKNGSRVPTGLQVMASSVGEPRDIGMVEVSPEGVFTGTYSFEGSISGYAALSFQADGETLCSTHYTVMEYTKPAYVLTAEFDKAYYRAGETLTVDISAQFFDGTPVSGLELALSKDEYGEAITMDESGAASAAVPARTYGNSWTPTTQYVNVSTAGAEDVYVNAFDQAYYFPSDYMLTADVSEEGPLSVDIQSNAIDFKAFEAEMNDYYSHIDELRGESADVSGTATLVRCYYEKYPTGSYYDAINKVTVETYDYERHEETVYSEPFTTANGRYTTAPYPNADYSDNAYYRMDVAYTSPDGVSFETSVYLGSSYYPGGYYTGYYLLREDADSGSLKLGETATFGVVGTEPVTEGTSLYTIMTDRLLRYDIAKGNQLDLTFTEEMIPNVVLYAAYFDGRHVYSVRQAYVCYDYTERELNVEITTDQDTYSPGATVQGTIHVEDADGNPLAANYAVGVVDEALFAIMDQQIDPTASLYALHYYEEPARFVSYIDKMLSDLYAEGGGDGIAAEARSNFADTAAFLTGRTNDSGDADFSFQLPDNLTSWRITSAVVTDHVYAGSATHNVEVSIPFFMNLVLNDSYTAGDDVSLSARAYGAEDGSAVTYTVTVDGKPVMETTGKVGEYTYMNLGPLAAGSHEITIFANSGSRRDGITRKVLVEESRHELTGLVYGNLSDPVDIDAVKYPVTMILYDAERQVYMSALSELLSMSGKRVDQALARMTAADILSVLDPEDTAQTDRPELAAYQGHNGGVRLFSYADPDALTTALALITASEHIDAGAAVNYLYDIVKDRDAASGEVAAAYMGLAAMREPVLSDLRVLIDSPDGFTDSDRILFACALALLGDDDGASGLYQALVLPYLKTSDTWSYIDTGTFEENYAATVSASLLANLTGSPELDGFILYLIGNESGETLPAFALMSYLKNNALPTAEASFSCNYNGENKTWSLTDSPIVILQFNRDELALANFRVLSGSVGYTAVYTGDVGSIQANAGNQISVKTSCGPENLAVGNVVTFTSYVTFSEDCPGETYTLDLVLPSGTRYSNYEYVHNTGCHLISQEANRLTFLLDRRSYTEGDTSLRSDFTVKIQVRAVLKGSFILEEPIVKGLESSLLALGDKILLTIE